MTEPASTPKKVARIAAAVASLGAVPVVYVVAGVAIVGGGCFIYYYWYRRDPSQQPAPTPVSVSLDDVQPRSHMSIRRRLWRTGRPSSAANQPQDNNANDVGSSSERRALDIFGDPREISCNLEPDNFPLNAVSEWRTEEERSEVLRQFANHNGGAANELTGMDQHPAVSSSTPISFEFGSSPGGNLSELGSPSPTNFVSPGPRSPPYLFHP